MCHCHFPFTLQLILKNDLEENMKCTDQLVQLNDEVTLHRGKLEKLNKSAHHLLNHCVSSDGNISRNVSCNQCN